MAGLEPAGEGVCLDSPSESIRAFSSEVIIYPGLSGELSSSICGSSGSWFIPGSGSRFACEENWNGFDDCTFCKFRINVPLQKVSFLAAH